jgi:hypothetical protein
LLLCCHHFFFFLAPVLFAYSSVTSVSPLYAHQAHRLSQPNGETLRKKQAIGWTASTITNADLTKDKEEGF